jgi:hypothetical protein
MSVDFTKLKIVFKPKAVAKQQRRAPTNVLPNKRLTKLVPGQVIQDEDGSFTVHIKYFDYLDKLAKDVKINELGKNGLTIPFTEDSYDMSNSERVFTRIGQRNRQYVSLIRTESDRIFKSPDPNRYVPFCHNWICSCWIVRVCGKLYAKFNKIITIIGHDYNVKHLIDKEEDI